VTKVKHFNDALVFLDSVVNENGTVLQLAHAGPFSNCATHAGEPAEQIDVVEQGAAKTHGCFAIVLGNMADDFSEVV
jgi:hypothetical protein